jgi:D-3-phosphoglycerate dehydrogenase / 2-oxoglutarate reductase
MPNVLVAGKIHPSGLDLLRSGGMSIDYVEEVSAASYLPFIDRADAVLIRTQPMPASAIEQASRLSIVSRHGVGYDAVDVEALNRRDIPLAVVGDVNSRPVAEHAMLLLLASAKRLLRYDAAVRTAGLDYRNSLEASELDGKTLLIIGFGRIGRLVAAMARPFGVTSIAFDPFQSAEAVAAAGVEPVRDLATALGQADFVTIHAPKTGTRPLIGASELALMKPGAIIVNTSRGGIVEEAALAEALHAGTIAGAGLDVFELEPPSPDDALLGEDRIVLTPHSASLTRECAARMSIAAAKNILDFFAGRLDPALVVNRAAIKAFSLDPS